MMRLKDGWRVLRAIGLVLLLSVFVQLAHADSGKTDAYYSSVIALTALPPEAHTTLRAIKQGGPFAFDRDGVVFGNRERILPNRPRGYYHEYTVKTPGIHSRGARRIVSGQPGEYYYTSDHYQTFHRIKE